MKCFVWNTRGDIIGDSVKEAALFEYLSKEFNFIETNGTSIVSKIHQNNPYIKNYHVISEQSYLTSKKNKLAKVYFLFLSIKKVLPLLRNCDVCVLTQNMWYPYFFIAKLFGKKVLWKERLPYKRYIPAMYFDAGEVFMLPNCIKRIVVNIESKDHSRCWPVENYLDVLNAIRSDYQIVLLGTSKKYNESLVNNLNKQVINLVGMTTIRETAMIIRDADLYLGNDSGLSHIAAAVGTDVLNIMLDSTVDILSSNKTIKLRQPSVANVVQTINEW